MRRSYNEKDLSFYDEAQGIVGDLVVAEFQDIQTDEEGNLSEVISQDLKLTGPYESARQDLLNRIRTQTGDWRSHPRIGGDLELLEGQPNTKETAMQGVAQIHATLTYDGRFDARDLTVRPVPVSIYQIDYYAMVDSSEDETIFVRESADL